MRINPFFIDRDAASNDRRQRGGMDDLRQSRGATWSQGQLRCNLDCLHRKLHKRLTNGDAPNQLERCDE